MSIAPTNTGTIIWDFGAEVTSGVVDGLQGIKNDADAYRDTLNLGANILELGHLVPASAPGLTRLSESSCGVVDLLRFPYDVVCLCDEVVKSVQEKKFKLAVLEKLSFVTAGALGATMWLSARGFVIPTQMINGMDRTFRLFGTSVAVNAPFMLNILLAVGFTFVGIGAIRDLVDIQADQTLDDQTKFLRTTHRLLVVARCVAQVAACVLFASAIAAGTTAALAPAVLALGTLALALAVVEFLYRRGRMDRLGIN